jgi:hypothetical protein
MNRVTPQMRNFAERLIRCEEVLMKPSDNRAPADFPVPERLRPQLATLMGNGGFRALLARSLSLAAREVPWLTAVSVKADGTLEWEEDLRAALDPGEFFEARVVLLAQLLGLLIAFIGETLTLQLVRDIWPRVPLDHLNFGEGGENEKK